MLISTCRLNSRRSANLSFSPFVNACQIIIRNRSPPSINRNITIVNNVESINLLLEKTRFNQRQWCLQTKEVSTSHFATSASKSRTKGKKNIDTVTDTFDKMAQEQGFDTTTAYFAQESSFEDEFKYDDEDNSSILQKLHKDSDISVLESEKRKEIAESAQYDEVVGQATKVPQNVRNYPLEVSPVSLKGLGFRHEKNPFGNDETPRKELLRLSSSAMVCSACGSDFQSVNEIKPGYLPPEKYEIQVNLSKLEEVQQNPEEKVEYAVDVSTATTGDTKGTTSQNMAEELGLDLAEIAKKKVICKRCHGLQNFGQVPENLRPGWTKEPMLSQDAFRKLLLPLREKKTVIIALVDLFDFSGSVLPDLDSIAGENPVIVAVNKVDLLPSKMGHTRAEKWVRRELEYLGVKSIANIGGAVKLVSSKSGFGVDQMLKKARIVARDSNSDVYVVGAANAGKSTLINYILSKSDDKPKNKVAKKRAGNANTMKGSVTTSPMPGTTLKFIKLESGNGQNIYDTPGLLIPGALTERLTPQELKMVVPKKQVEPVTFRLASGKCVLVGGMAKIEIIGDSMPFLLTFFVSNDIKLHPTDSSRADDTLLKHVGTMLTPPLEPGPERMKEIGELEYHELKIDGAGWKEAASDIAIRGLGWISVTGVGTAKVRIGVPTGVGVSVRPPLMPFDVWEATAKYTGGRTVRNPKKSKFGKKRRGVGRR